MQMPSKPEILSLVDTEPRTVISFANRLFSRADFSQRELFEIASKLIPRVNPEDRIHLWEAATAMMRSEQIEGSEDWYYLAKARLLSPNAHPFEHGAIRDFLGDQRICLSADITRSTSNFTAEYKKYMSIADAGMNVKESEFVDFFNSLESACEDESFLVRESVAEALSAPCTRSDIEDKSMFPFREQIRSMVHNLAKDSNPYLIETLDATVYFLKLSELI